MRILNALSEGTRLVRESSKYVLLAYATSVALALPLAAALFTTLHASFGHGAAAETMREGFDDLWFQGFSARTEGLSSTFGPSVVGVGPVLDALDALVSARILFNHPSIVGVGLTYLVAWILFSAGFVAWYSGRREHGFFGEAARYFPRFAALAAVAAAMYALVFGVVLPSLTALVDELVREVTDERAHFAFTVAKYLVVWAIAWCVSLVVGYAKILSVIEGRLPMRKTLIRAARTVLTNKREVFGLSAAVAILTIAVMLLYWIVAPGVGQESWAMVLLAFATAQVYLVFRVAIRCLIHASQTRLCISLARKG